MSISHKHKFIFIKTVKTAATSLEVFLSQHCGPDDVLTLFDPPIEGHQPRNYNGSGDHISEILRIPFGPRSEWDADRKSTRLNSSHVESSYAVFCLKKKRATPAI